MSDFLSIGPEESDHVFVMKARANLRAEDRERIIGLWKAAFAGRGFYPPGLVIIGPDVDLLGPDGQAHQKRLMTEEDLRPLSNWRAVTSPTETASSTASSGPPSAPRLSPTDAQAVMSYRLADFDVRDFETLYAMHAKAADEALLKLKDAKLKRDARLKAMLDAVNAPRPKGEKGSWPKGEKG